ncbi:pentapeptide repeat-containing protein [Amycolatopsis magusensis]|uniref:pentapeptide repeat-containing protein n=1 Tax=Amycolatopsis magusensis TaxID=882444 RepID=UPI0024A930F0|nr:pentapeptide repeat-containing protein [Amycolatopsis magusensis]MDI5975469.1 pentapeptide repeat-containing protein [Amycolatopsis magusensis]
MALVVLVLAGVVLVALWRWIDGLALADPGQKDKATAHLDAVKIAASIVVAGGGVFALYLTARRQRTQEEELQVRRDELAQRDRAQAHTEQVAENNRLHAERLAATSEKDATNRQITELFTKAVEQLGHDEAAVRLGGLYTLERLAQDHVEQQRPVVNVLCAYLRMPYLDPDQPSPTEDEIAVGMVPINEQERRERRQEREVRLTVQGLLREHAFNGPEPGCSAALTYWGSDDPAADIYINLSGATLIEIDLSNQRVHPNAIFSRATFTGDSRFVLARFVETAEFEHAEFVGDVSFSGAKFAGDMRFAGATFDGEAWFRGVKVAGEASFGGAKFTGDAGFDGAEFTGNARFGKAQFTDTARFEEAEFVGDARFDEAQFTSEGRFNEAKFNGTARFSGVHFPNQCEFGGAQARQLVDAGHAWPSGWSLATLPVDVAPHGNGVWLALVRDDELEDVSSRDS